ncbi:receptor L domain-containing protein [Wenyingzhuangia aestuarii]|uniref:hypothetical protein n=1 Tax=Wenyingzhuangia aestuarii TaxID=1647582 RepID=UPI00143B9FF9|nr:hypothetical protein [Wenyingzhuangia aestuarii]NJB84148.1 hypothetical protein [Wenyingzhuangia aestuarii]
MKKIFEMSIFILLIFIVSCSENEGEIELEVLPVEKINVSVAGGIPVMNGTIEFIAGENTPKDASYRMYFDTSENPSTLFNLETTEKKYNNLKINQKYYWRVETISNNGNILANSPIWSFTTGNNVTIRTQEEVELLSNHKYTIIPGTLTIGDFIPLSGTIPNPTNISNLSSLNNIIQIGQLVINNNSQLKNLNGLGNVETIDGSLFIGQGLDMKGGNSSLENINDLQNIKSIGGHLIIYNNSKLENLKGLDNLESIGRDLIIENNENLTDLCSLKSFLENFEIKGNYSVKENNFNPTKENIIEGNCKK